MVEHLLVPHTSWLFGVSTILGKGQFWVRVKLLAGAIDPTKIQYVDRQTYFVIFVDTVKKWIARLYFQNLGQAKVELPGNKFFNTDQIKNLLHHKEDFISAVKSRIQ
jgi:hypothetical protein